MKKKEIELYKKLYRSKKFEVTKNFDNNTL